MSWDELKHDIGCGYSFVKWLLYACLIGGILWSLKNCSWQKFWDSGLY